MNGRLWMVIGVAFVLGMAAIGFIGNGVNPNRQQAPATTVPAGVPERGSVMRKADVSPEVIKLQQELRGAVLKEWVDAAEDVVALSKDEQAKKVLQYVYDHGVLGMPYAVPDLPDAVGVLTLETTSADPWVIVVPLQQEDERVDKAWRDRLNHAGAFAFFSPEQRAIILRTNLKVSPRWKALMFLHECAHAQEWMTEEYDWTDPKVFCYREMGVHTMQNRLAFALGGDRYAECLANEKKRITKVLSDMKIQIREGFADRGEYDLMLEAAFGPALSEVEKDARQTQVWMHATFDLLDKEFGEGGPEMKAIYMKNIYAKTGLLPSQGR